MTRALHVLMALALVFTVVGPLRSDLPSWAWSWWLLASLVALVVWARAHRAAAGHGTVAESPSGVGSGFWPGPMPAHLRPALLMLLSAALIDLFMGLWHGGGWDLLRQDGKVLLSLPMAWLVLAGLGLHGRSTDPQATDLHPTAALYETLCWAMGLQMVVALAVALYWPRAWLPATPIPWATAVALNVAVLAPLALVRPGASGGAALSFEGRAWRLGLGLAVLAGVVAVVLSRSRAAWVVLPWLGLLVVAYAPRRAVAAVAVLAMMGAVLGAGLWYDSLQPAQVERGIRLLDLVQELTQWNQPDAGTSVGSRLALWEAAWNSLWAHPWVGIGVEARIALVQTVVPPDTLPDVAPLVHVHQQFLNQAVDHGLPGLMAALLCAGAPFALAWRAPTTTMRWQCLGVGVVHTVGLMFNANMTHGTYAVNFGLVLMAILWMQASRDAAGGHDA
ncbi:MAG: O-antigen ligase family protein [Betaproteobacteria bacterium]